METISLRCFDPDIDGLFRRHIAPILKLKEVKQSFEVNVYQNSRLEMDIVLAIRSNNGAASYRKSNFALRLADNLKSFGIINHVVWHEINF
ncbi:hypothetical protein KJ966_18385 [bacterium]|nr:hypothetical protein [bacterium]